MRTKFLQRALCVGLGVAAAATAASPALAASPFLTNTATCPAGLVTIGGGSQVVGEGSADFKTLLQESSPGTINGGAQSLWFTSLRNADVSPHTVGLFAVCSKPPKGYQVVRKDVSVAARAFLRDTVACPEGKVVLAGGSSVVGEGSADFKTRLQESAPGTVNGGAQSVWLTALRNADAKAHTIGQFAVCANPPKGYQVVRKDTLVPAGGFLRSTANCPSGRVVFGGGASVIGAGTGDFRTRMQETAPGTTGSPSVSVHMAAVRNNSTVARTIGIHAVCAVAPSAYQVVRRDLVVG